MAIIQKPPGQIDPPNTVPSKPAGQVGTPNTIPSEAAGQISTPNNIPSQAAGQVSAPNNVPAQPAGSVGAPNTIPPQPVQPIDVPNSVPAQDAREIPKIICDAVTLDFKNQMYAQNGEGKNLSDIMTFSRASDSSVINDGIVNTVGVDVPAIGDDGLSAYESKANLLTWSEEFSNPAWTGPAAVTPSAAISPDGTQNASLLSTDAVNFSNVQQVIVASATQVTFSVFLKVGGSFEPVLRVEGVNIGGSEPFSGYTFNLNTKQASYLNGGVADATEIREIGGGWLLCSLTVSGDSFSAIKLYPKWQSSDAADTVLAWGAMVSESAFVAPYIKTESTTVTRASDVASIGTENLPAAGQPVSFVVDAYVAPVTGFFFESGGGADKYLGLFHGETGSTQLRFGTSTNGFGVSAALGEVSRFVLSYDGSKATLHINGVKAPNEISLLTGAPVDPLIIGSNGGSTQQLNGETGVVRVIHRALTDDEAVMLGGPDV